MNKKQRLTLRVGIFFSLIFLLIVILRCNSEKDCLIEYYENGNIKTRVCPISLDKKHFSYISFYENGNIEHEFSLINDRPSGEFIEYYESGEIKRKSIFVKGEQQGDSYNYSREGKIDLYNFYVNGKVVYLKDYLYASENQSFVEGFIPFLKFQQDTIEATKGSIEFEVSLPIPDSLLQNRKLFFAYEMKPLSLKDSIIEYPVNEVLLNNKKVFSQSIELEKAETQIFYGHIIDKEDNHIYQPFEKVITVSKEESLQETVPK